MSVVQAIRANGDHRSLRVAQRLKGQLPRPNGRCEDATSIYRCMRFGTFLGPIIHFDIEANPYRSRAQQHAPRRGALGESFRDPGDMNDRQVTTTNLPDDALGTLTATASAPKNTRCATISSRAERRTHGNRRHHARPFERNADIPPEVRRHEDGRGVRGRRQRLDEDIHSTCGEYQRRTSTWASFGYGARWSLHCIHGRRVAAVSCVNFDESPPLLSIFCEVTPIPGGRICLTSALTVGTLGRERQRCSRGPAEFVKDLGGDG